MASLSHNVGSFGPGRRRFGRGRARGDVSGDVDRSLKLRPETGDNTRDMIPGLKNAAGATCALFALFSLAGPAAAQPDPTAEAADLGTAPAAAAPGPLAPPPLADPNAPPAPPPVAGEIPAGPAVAPEAPAPARAEPAPGAPAAWLVTGDLGGALLLSQPQSSLFGPGVTGSIAAFRAFFPAQPSLLLGLRLRGGVYADGDAPADVTRADPGNGGFAAALLALRWRPSLAAVLPSTAAAGAGPWVEIAAGGGVTGDLPRPMAEAGLGWDFSVGPIVAGPMLRYHHVLQPGDGDDGADAKMLFFGVEVALASPVVVASPPAAMPVVVAAPAPPPIDSDGDGIMDPDDRCPTTPEDVDGFEDQDGCPDDDNDRDGIPDALDKCPNQPEVVNGIEDQDGCPDEGLITMVDDKVVLEEEVLFETDRARVSSTGRKALAAVEQLCRQHPEWELLQVEGHADERGDLAYNQRLSEERSEQVRKVLLELGFDDKKVAAKGFGATRPRAQGHDEESWRLNRRVELVVIRKRPASLPAGAAAAPPSAPPPNLVPAPRPAKAAPPAAAAPARRPAAAPAAKPEPEAKPPAPKRPSNKPAGTPARSGLEGVEEGQ